MCAIGPMVRSARARHPSAERQPSSGRQVPSARLIADRGRGQRERAGDPRPVGRPHALRPRDAAAGQRAEAARLHGQRHSRPAPNHADQQRQELAGEEADGRDRRAARLDAPRAARHADGLPLLGEQRQEAERRQDPDREARRHPELLDQRVGDVDRIAGGGGQQAGQRDRQQPQREAGPVGEGLGADPERPERRRPSARPVRRRRGR